MSGYIESKVHELEKSVHKHDKMVWVVISLALIFGLSGGWGFNTISKLKSELDTANKELLKLNTEVKLTKKDFSEFLSSKKLEINTLTKRQLANATEKIDDFNDQKISELSKKADDLQRELDSNSLAERVVVLEKIKIGDFVFPKLKANEIEIVNKNAKTLIYIGASTNENGGIWIYNSKGINTGHFASKSSYSSLMIFNAEKKILVHLGAINNKGGLRLNKEDGSDLALIAAPWIDSGGGVWVTDELGNEKELD